MEETVKEKQVKDIKDYLHLYLGCQCMNNDGDITRLDGRYIEWMLTGKYDHLGVPLLILRRLSDMTEEDGGRIFGSRKKYMLYKKERDANPTDLFLFTPLEFSRLLKEGFDLYNLIHEGLAIDKATLPPL